MGIFKIIRNTNDSLGYMNNALNYTMGTHTDYDNRYSPNVDIYNAYEQFLLVKKYFGKTSENSGCITFYQFCLLSVRVICILKSDLIKSDYSIFDFPNNQVLFSFAVISE